MTDFIIPTYLVILTKNSIIPINFRHTDLFLVILIKLCHTERSEVSICKPLLYDK